MLQVLELLTVQYVLRMADAKQLLFSAGTWSVDPWQQGVSSLDLVHCCACSSSEG